MLYLIRNGMNGHAGFGGKRHTGCRGLAVQFNRLHGAQGMRVGKSFVADMLKRQSLEALRAREDFKYHVPSMKPKNQMWGMDSTLLELQTPAEQLVIGVIDHCTRVLTGLRKVTRFNA
jgi:putative transposase